MTGNIFGGRCSAFNYNDVVSVEIRKNLNTGVLEILSSATRDKHLSYWNQGENSAFKSNYAVTLPVRILPNSSKPQLLLGYDP